MVFAMVTYILDLDTTNTCFSEECRLYQQMVRTQLGQDKAKCLKDKEAWWTHMHNKHFPGGRPLTEDFSFSEVFSDCVGKYCSIDFVTRTSCNECPDEILSISADNYEVIYLTGDGNTLEDLVQHWLAPSPPLSPYECTRGHQIGTTQKLLVGKCPPVVAVSIPTRKLASGEPYTTCTFPAEFSTLVRHNDMSIEVTKFRIIGMILCSLDHYSSIWMVPGTDDAMWYDGISKVGVNLHWLRRLKVGGYWCIDQHPMLSTTQRGVEIVFLERIYDDGTCWSDVFRVASQPVEHNEDDIQMTDAPVISEQLSDVDATQRNKTVDTDAQDMTADAELPRASAKPVDAHVPTSKLPETQPRPPKASRSNMFTTESNPPLLPRSSPRFPPQASSQKKKGPPARSLKSRIAMPTRGHPYTAEPTRTPERTPERTPDPKTNNPSTSRQITEVRAIIQRTKTRPWDLQFILYNKPSPCGWTTPDGKELSVFMKQSEWSLDFKKIALKVHPDKISMLGNVFTDKDLQDAMTVLYQCKDAMLERGVDEDKYHRTIPKGWLNGLKHANNIPQVDDSVVELRAANCLGGLRQHRDGQMPTGLEWWEDEWEDVLF